MEVLEKSTVQTICKLEKICPPSFFDSMEHLVIHLPYEAKVRGPVQYSWMYPFERRMFDLKQSVKNKARIEGCSVKKYIRSELAYFTSHYADEDTVLDTSLNTLRINEVMTKAENDYQLPIFIPCGRPIGAKFKSRILTSKEYNAVALYVVLNCDEIEPWLEMFDEEIGATNLMDGQLIEKRTADFVLWFKYSLSSGKFKVKASLRSLIKGPLHCVDTYRGYMINGYRFHAEDYGKTKKTMYIGVCV